MDAVVAIFEQLGADKSLLYQFVIFVVVFVVAKFGFFQHLQNVLETREDRTVKLEGNAEAKFEEVNRLSEEYKQRIHTANKEAREKFDKEKFSVEKDEETRYRSKEKEISEYVDNSRTELLQGLQAKKDQVMKEADQLAETLVQKITKG